MVARVTLAEIDAVRNSVEGAVERFRESVVPALSEMDGYRGVYVLTTADGKALVMTFWADEESAEAGLASGHYADQVQKFATLYRSTPGRETYGVALADAPAVLIE
jgi:heme-degrading monooxygenase HmoA